MPMVSDVYAGKFLDVAQVKAAGPVEFTVKGCGTVELKGRKKLQITFRETDRALSLNKTSAAALARAYGDDTDGWAGKPVRVQVAAVPFGSGTVEAVLVEPLANGSGRHVSKEGAQAGPAVERVGACVSRVVHFQDDAARGVYQIGLESGATLYTRDEAMARTAKDYCGMSQEVRAAWVEKPNAAGKAVKMLKALAEALPPVEAVAAGDEMQEDEIPF